MMNLSARAFPAACRGECHRPCPGVSGRIQMFISRQIEDSRRELPGIFNPVRLGKILGLIWMLCLVPVLLSQGKGGRWQFENDGRDTGDWDAVADTGSLANGASYQSEAPLQEGVAYLFLDGALNNNCYLVPDSPDLDFDAEDIAISAWVFPTLLNDVHFILNKGDNHKNPKTTNYALRISTNRNLEFLIRDADNKAQTAASSFTIPADQWTFIAVFYDYSAGRIMMWNAPDRAAVDTLIFNKAYFSNADPLCICAWYSSDPAASTVKDFKGRIDDVRVSGRLEDVITAPTAVDFGKQPPIQQGNRELRVFPNPVVLSTSGGGLNVSIGRDFKEETTISLYNLLGQEILSTSWNQVGSGQKGLIPLDRMRSLLKTGVYFLRVADSGRSAVRKVFVIR